MIIKYKIEEIEITAKKIFDYMSENKDIKVILFEGKMGSGKTTLIKEVCKKLGVIDVVTSPTFAIISEYRTQTAKMVYHFDFYRIEKLQDAINIGTEDYFYSDNYCFLEWSQIVKPILPEKVITINIEEIDEKTRIINCY